MLRIYIISIFINNQISLYENNQLEIKYFNLLFKYNIIDNYSKIINLYYEILLSNTKIKHINNQFGFLGNIINFNSNIINNIFTEINLELSYIYNLIEIIINDMWEKTI